MPIARSARLWSLPEAPPQVIEAAPDGYGVGIVALVWGGTPDGSAPVDWLDGLPTALGLTPEVSATLCIRNADAFLWTAYWDPTGQVTPADPKVPPLPE